MNCPKRDDDGRLCSNDVGAFWGERDSTNRGAAANIWRVANGKGESGRDGHGRQRA